MDHFPALPHTHLIQTLSTHTNTLPIPSTHTNTHSTHPIPTHTQTQTLSPSPPHTHKQTQQENQRVNKQTNKPNKQPNYVFWHYNAHLQHCLTTTATSRGIHGQWQCLGQSVVLVVAELFDIAPIT